ncbi:MAG: hypothetical protein LWW81_05850 [Rhodocyclales bacterium]|nr:hypothetical protein [Rhodocyclales bacterium]
MKSKFSIERGAKYLCVKLGEVVTAMQEVAMVKGHPMWEVERDGGSLKKRYIVPARALSPLSPG